MDRDVVVTEIRSSWFKVKGLMFKAKKLKTKPVRSEK